MTGPYIANAVRAMGRHSNNPSEEHWNAVLKILSYLRGKRGRTLAVMQGHGRGVSVYVGADYGKELNGRRSVSGAAVLCGGACVCWKSTTQKLFHFVHYGCRVRGVWGWNKGDTVYVCTLGSFCGRICEESRSLCIRRERGGSSFGRNTLSSARSKHVDVRHHFIRGLVRCGKIKMKSVSSELTTC